MINDDIMMDCIKKSMPIYIHMEFRIINLK